MMAGSFNIWERDAVRPTDRELLERAARAYGCQGLAWRNGSQCFYYDDPETGREEWNPLQCLDQAMRLAVLKGFTVATSAGNGQKARVWDRFGVSLCTVGHNGNPVAATCRAIVQAAAETLDRGTA